MRFEGEDAWAKIRPTHADFQRLVDIVNWIEDQKLRGRTPGEVYSELMNMHSVAYMATNRCALDLPLGKHVFSAREVLEHSADEWMEGFMFGMEFQKRGGHASE